ncbi:MAG: CPBP family intramembrane metalloprotease [Mycoplasmataceae bacterium]|nr:CPBP family intramembrane metalloprotease [Mycoplasmataceae bacterium]
MNSQVSFTEKGMTNQSGWTIILAYIFIPTLISIISLSISDSILSKSISILIGAIVFLIVIFFAVNETRMNLFNTIDNKWVKYLLLSILLIIGYYFLNFILNIILASIYSSANDLTIWEFWGKPTSINQQEVENIVKSTPAMSFFSIVLLTPLMEEIVFRQGIFLVNKDKRIATLISIVVFTLVHMIGTIGNPENLWYIGSYILIATSLTFIYNWTDEKLAYSHASHILINLVAYIVLMAN